MPEKSETEQEWVQVCTLDELPDGTSKKVSYQGEEIALFNADGEIYAIGDECTHAETSLSEGEFYEDIRGWVVECPLHGSQFDLATGNAISLPATGCAGKWEVKVEAGAVYLNPRPLAKWRR